MNAIEAQTDPDSSSEHVVDLPIQLIAEVLAAVGEGRVDDVRRLVKPLHHADLADLIQMARSDHRTALIDIFRDQ
ncbi:MAG: hypothetical protein O3A84_12260, partial [Proteobacteria bacterium]|nr:hypothetical protein [Pseudomonadota bacterium]